MLATLAIGSVVLQGPGGYMSARALLHPRFYLQEARVSHATATEYEPAKVAIDIGRGTAGFEIAGPKSAEVANGGNRPTTPSN